MLDFSVTFIITLINIAILCFILRVILFKPVTKFMTDRAKRVQDSIDGAERERAEAKRMLAEYEDTLKKAGDEAAQLIREARENAAKEAQRILAEAKADAANFSVNARKQIETERQAALAKFRIEAAALVLAASSRLAQRELTGDDNRKYANMLLDELSAKIPPALKRKV